MKLEVGDRVKLIDNDGISHTCDAPLGTEATIRASYTVEGYEYVDVDWHVNGHRWMDYGFLAERFQKLYPQPGGGFAERPPYDPYDPHNWNLGF